MFPWDGRKKALREGSLVFVLNTTQHGTGALDHSGLAAPATVGGAEPRTRRLPRIPLRGGWRNQSRSVQTHTGKNTDVEGKPESLAKASLGGRTSVLPSAGEFCATCAQPFLKFPSHGLGSKQPTLETTERASLSPFPFGWQDDLDTEGEAKVRRKWTQASFGVRESYSLCGRWRSCRDIALGARSAGLLHTQSSRSRAQRGSSLL